MKLIAGFVAGLAMINAILAIPIATQHDNLALAISNGTTVKPENRHKNSHNWAGAVLTGSDFQSVTGTFTVPMINLPTDRGKDSHLEYAAGVWVGIDGSNECQGVVMQTGVNMWISPNGDLDYNAWYEWYPEHSIKFRHFSVSPGDNLTLTISASSDSGGMAIIENDTTGKSVRHKFVGRNPHLCRTNAEWIVEDFSHRKSRVPFADFGSVTFTNALATTGNGTKFGPAGSRIEDIVTTYKDQENVLLTNATVDESSVSVIYGKRPIPEDYGLVTG
ncbi:hypothetical protein E4T48_03798 [Aureobasidium sp. EXF-10727]|nr:hypothetical protein E4T48_03798 [Aureobasidium sp. EXF-10727]